MVHEPENDPLDDLDDDFPAGDASLWRTWRAWVILLLLAAGVGGFLVWRQLQPGVSVRVDPAPTALGRPSRTLSLRLQAHVGSLASVEARVVQGATVRTVFVEEFSTPIPPIAERALPLDAGALGLTEGPARLEVFARDTVWRLRPDPRPRLVHGFTVDLTAPQLELRTATRYVARAGAGVAVYRVKEAARSGIQVGAAYFPGVSGLAVDPAVHATLFVLPYDELEARPQVLAEDEAGNQRILELPVSFLPTRFPMDRMTLTEGFLRRKVPELVPDTPETASAEELLEAYLQVNREGRRAAEAILRETTRSESMATPLWRGTFRQQRNTLVTARFPERRTYIWNQRVVDTQWHLGIDLASRKRSPVEASNAGRVVFTGPNGIYGNTVVLDHGLGLFTLYAHLSTIAVEAGQLVAQGEVLGQTGETGLAGGDHLHFAVLIHGVYATPLEWWDQAWIRDRIAAPLVEGGITLPGITDLD